MTQKVIICFILATLIVCTNLYGQDRTLSLKHKNTGYVYDVDPEKAVKYRLNVGGTKRGYIQDLSEEWMTINGQKVLYEDITMLASWHTRKNASAKTGGILLTSLGGILTTAGVIVTVQGVKEENEVGTVIAVPVGLAASGVGIGTTYLGLRALRRKRFDMMEWSFVINNY